MRKTYRIKRLRHRVFGTRIVGSGNTVIGDGVIFEIIRKSLEIFRYTLRGLQYYSH